MEGKSKEQQKKTNIQPKYNTPKSKHNNGGHKNKTTNNCQRGQKNNLRTLNRAHVTSNTSSKKLDGKHVRAPNLKKTSRSTNVHLTMEVS